MKRKIAIILSASMLVNSISWERFAVRAEDEIIDVDEQIELEKSNEEIEI